MIPGGMLELLAMAAGAGAAEVAPTAPAITSVAQEPDSDPANRTALVRFTVRAETTQSVVYRRNAGAAVTVNTPTAGPFDTTGVSSAIGARSDTWMLTPYAGADGTGAAGTPVGITTIIPVVA